MGCNVCWTPLGFVIFIKFQHSPAVVTDEETSKVKTCPKWTRQVLTRQDLSKVKTLEVGDGDLLKKICRPAELIGGWLIKWQQIWLSLIVFMKNVH